MTQKQQEVEFLVSYKTSQKKRKTEVTLYKIKTTIKTPLTKNSEQ